MPPTYPQINDQLLQTQLFQSILVTQFHHHRQGDNTHGNDNDGDYNDNDAYSSNDSESFDPPWPIEHEAFCALPTVQEHVVLEIAAGLNTKGQTVSPMELPKGKMRVILPGSLRERGEFCLVDVAFMKDNSGGATSSTTTTATATTTANGLNAAASAGSSSTSPPPKLKSSPHQQAPASSLGNYRWMVRQTRFHCLNDFV
jgi:hypothetical protein